MRFFVCFTVLASVCLISCQKSSSPNSVSDSGNFLATMDGYILDQEEFESVTQNLTPDQRKDLDDETKRDQFVRLWMGVMSLYKAGLDMDLQDDPAYLENLRYQERKLLADRHREIILQSVELSDAELKVYYENRQDQFRHPVLFRFDQLVFPSLGTAKEAQDQLSKGVPFSELAERFSKGQYSHLGGDSGWVQPGEVDPAIEQTVFSLNVDDISPPFQTLTGWRIVKVTDRRPAGIFTFEEVKEDLRPTLLAQKRNQSLETEVQELFKKYNVTFRAAPGS